MRNSGEEEDSGEEESGAEQGDSGEEERDSGGEESGAEQGDSYAERESGEEEEDSGLEQIGVEEETGAEEEDGDEQEKVLQSWVLPKSASRITGSQMPKRKVGSLKRKAVKGITALGKRKAFAVAKGSAFSLLTGNVPGAAIGALGGLLRG